MTEQAPQLGVETHRVSEREVSREIDRERWRSADA